MSPMRLLDLLPWAQCRYSRSRPLAAWPDTGTYQVPHSLSILCAAMVGKCLAVSVTRPATERFLPRLRSRHRSPPNLSGHEAAWQDIDALKKPYLAPEHQERTQVMLKVTFMFALLYGAGLLLPGLARAAVDVYSVEEFSCFDSV